MTRTIGNWLTHSRRLPGSAAAAAAQRPDFDRPTLWDWGQRRDREVWWPKVEAGATLRGDNDTPPQWLMLLMLEKAAHLIVFGGNFSPAVAQPSGLGQGAQGSRAETFAECEFAWCPGTGNAKVLTRDPANRDYEHKVHPTQKPVRVLNGP